MRKILWFAAATILLFPASGWCQESSQGTSQASGQSSGSQQKSLADAARKAREQKKETPKAAKVFTNDDMPSGGGISTVGQAAGAPEAEAAGEAAAPTPSENNEKAWRDRFAQLRHKLDSDKAELDILQRELGVANVQNYSDPVKAMQQELTREDINKKTAAIEAKQKAVEADEKAISDAEDQLRKSGGDSGWAR